MHGDKNRDKKEQVINNDYLKQSFDLRVNCRLVNIMIFIKVDKRHYILFKKTLRENNQVKKKS